MAKKKARGRAAKPSKRTVESKRKKSGGARRKKVTRKAASKNQARGRKKVTAERQDALAAAAGDQSLDKVRDLLFGREMRQHEQRIGTLEERLKKDVSKLRADYRARLEALEETVKREIRGATDRLRDERAAREEADKGIGAELRALGKALREQLTTAERQSARAVRELRLDVNRQTKELGTQCEELSEQFAVELEDLEARATDRSALAGMLQDLAKKLRAEDGAT